MYPVWWHFLVSTVSTLNSDTNHIHVLPIADSLGRPKNKQEEMDWPKYSLESIHIEQQSDRCISLQIRFLNWREKEPSTSHNNQIWRMFKIVQFSKLRQTVSCLIHKTNSLWRHRSYFFNTKILCLTPIILSRIIHWIVQLWNPSMKHFENSWNSISVIATCVRILI